MTKLRIEKIKDFFLIKKKEGNQLIFFEKIDKNTSREQIKEKTISIRVSDFVID